MSLPRPVKYLLLLLLAFVAGTLYLRLLRDHDWGSSLLIALACAPFVVALWKFRDWCTARAQRAGRNWRASREERKRANRA
ncbi:hypothetical protein [Streptomyces sp. ODS05-4]|uniref:hypothetical protein n=1 Tax=Streptomyces sp. ODS05-4 TaxID=2944939 RepID=UPI00210DBDFF|nr:hypothetical protein [Streptomyces sp. ODS05-4]